MAFEEAFDVEIPDDKAQTILTGWRCNISPRNRLIKTI